MATRNQFPLQFRPAPEHAGKRLDQFLASELAGISRARVQQLISQGKVRVNEQEPKPSLRLRVGDQIAVLGPIELPPLRAIPQAIPLNIIYEDEDLAIINKPAGMVVHAGSGAGDEQRDRGTLANALLYHFGSLSRVGGELRPGIVHRLDKQTSGLMVVAKNDESHRQLAGQFALRQAKKTYLALVHGWLKPDRGTVESRISRDLVRRTRMTTRRQVGRQAITHYRVRQRLDTRYGRFTLLELMIDTGRTHQIRVQLASLAHPVVGDTLYGAPRELHAASVKKAETSSALSLGRNFLHAAALELVHPKTGKTLVFSHPLPVELQQFLTILEAHGPRVGL